MAKYQRESTRIMAILAGFSPLVEQLSVDEAFVDLTGTEGLWGPAPQAVRAMKTQILAATRLTASAGLAPNKFLAKVASDLEKPDGLVVVAPGREAAFLAPLSVERVWGVGRVTARTLRELGVGTIGQLQALPRDVLVRRLGEHGAALHDLAWGRDDRPVEPWSDPKSVGAEETFGRDCRDAERLRTTLREQAERVARELRGQGLAAATVTLKLRYPDFQTLTRRHTAEPTQDGLELYWRAATLLARERVTRPVRLIGVSASGLGPAGRGQLGLLDRAVLRRERLARAMDALDARFGAGTVVPATLLPDKARPR
jgi:DNA polymerase-4